MSGGLSAEERRAKLVELYKEVSGLHQMPPVTRPATKPSSGPATPTPT